VKGDTVARIDFGVVIHPTPRGSTVEAMLETDEYLLQKAVAHDFSIWMIDHFQFDSQPLLECFATLAHILGRYPTLRSGTLVVGQGYRNPALTAKIAATLQFLTQGKFILGIGAGWKEDEFRAYGYPYPSAKVRIAQLDEALQIIKGLWGPGPFSFTGEHYHVAEAYNEPRPEPAPPIMIGGGGEQRTLRVVARYADWWNADYYTAADYGRKLAVLRGYCREIGRDPESVTPTYYAGVSISRDPSTIVRQPPFKYRSDDMFVLNGDPDEVSAQIETFIDLGVRHMQLNFLDFPHTAGVDLFLNEVLPRFR